MVAASAPGSGGFGRCRCWASCMSPFRVCGFLQRRISVMRKVTMVLVFGAILGLAGWAVPGGGATGVNDEGFITAWLLLAPIPFEENQTGAHALGKQQVNDEAKLQTRPRDNVKSAARELG